MLCMLHAVRGSLRYSSLWQSVWSVLTPWPLEESLCPQNDWKETGIHNIEVEGMRLESKLDDQSVDLFIFDDNCAIFPIRRSRQSYLPVCWLHPYDSCRDKPISCWPDPTASLFSECWTKSLKMARFHTMPACTCTYLCWVTFSGLSLFAKLVILARIRWIGYHVTSQLFSSRSWICRRVSAKLPLMSFTRLLLRKTRSRLEIPEVLSSLL
jgi:hypothetical protein